MNIPCAAPSLKQLAIWLLAITLVSWSLGMLIVILDGGSPGTQGAEGSLPLVIPCPDADNAMIAIEMESGTINLSSGETGSLLSGMITGSRLTPPLHLAEAVVNGTCMITLKQNQPVFIDPLDEDDSWDLSLNPGLPVALSVENGAGDITVNSGTTPLTSLLIDAGAGNILVNLSGWSGVHMPVSVTVGIGDLTILLPEHAKIATSLENGIGTRTISGLDGVNGQYTRSAPGPGAPVLSLSVSQGVGDFTMRVVEEER